MDNSIVKFAFKDSVPMTEVEATLRLALLAVQSLHGEDRLRMEAHVNIDHARHTCLIDTAPEVGQTLAVIFAGYARREFGEEAIVIQTKMAAASDLAGSVA